MSLFGAVRLFVVMWSRPPAHPCAPTRTEPPPDVARGAWARWACANHGAMPRRSVGPRGIGAHGVGLGDACRTSVGRDGRFVEIVEGDRRMLICQEA